MSRKHHSVHSGSLGGELVRISARALGVATEPDLAARILSGFSGSKSLGDFNGRAMD